MKEKRVKFWFFSKKSAVFILGLALIFSVALISLNSNDFSAWATKPSAPLSYYAERVSAEDSLKYVRVTTLTSFFADEGLIFGDDLTLYEDFEGTGTFYSGRVIIDGKYYMSTKNGIRSADTTLFSGDFSGIVTHDGFLYASSGSDVLIFSITDSFDIVLEKTLVFSARVSSIVASSAAVYLSLDGLPQIHKIVGLQSGVVENNLVNLEAVAAHPSSDRLFVLSGGISGTIAAYQDSGGMLTRKNSVSSGGAERLAAGTDGVYFAVRDSGAYSFFSVTHQLTNLQLLAGSALTEDYFYRFPTGVSSRFGTIYVADTHNNRISALSDGGITQIEGYNSGADYYPFDQPKAAVMSLTGELFVAHKNLLTNTTSGKTISLFAPDSTEQSPKPLIIQKIIGDNDGNIFVLGSRNFSAEYFAYKTDESLSGFELLALDNPTAMGAKSGGSVLFLDGLTLVDKDGIEFLTLSESVIDFAVDYSGKVFGLNSAGSLVSGNGQLIDHGGRFDRLTLSTVGGGLCGYGDLLLVQSDTHMLLKISADLAGVSDISDFFTAPDIITDTAAHQKQVESIAKTLYSAPLFAQPTEAGSAFVIESGTDVFIRRDISAPVDMYFVIAEDREEKVLRGGYMYRSALSSPYPYEQPYKNNGRLVEKSGIYMHVYKYPSLYAPKVQLASNHLHLLYFAKNSEADNERFYADAGGNRWVRVDLGDTEGFVLEAGLSWSIFSDKVAQPNVNATIKENAPVYIKTASGDYELIEDNFTLESGKRVEVETPFDAGNKYTRVIFSIVKEGNIVEVVDIECFVETRFVDFDGVGVWQIVSIVVAVSAVVLAVVLGVWISHKRKKNKNLAI